MVPSTVLYIVSVMITSVCKEFYQFILAQGILGGLANGFLFTAAMSAIGHYFHKKRGAAMGMVAVGSSIGGVVIPIVLNECFKSKIGFGWGVRIVGFGMLAALVVSCILVKERLPPRHGAFFIPSAFLQPSYALVVAGLFLLMWGVFLPFFFLTGYALAEIHMDSDLAFYLISILNGTSLFGRLFFGASSDKIGLKNGLTFVGFVNGILILCWTTTSTSAGLVVWTAIFGFFSGGIFALFPAAIASVVPNPQMIGTYIGQAITVASLAALTGSPIGGALVTKYGFFDATVFAGISMLAGGALILAARFASNPKLLAIA